jgi:hypothetical protein
MIRIELPFLPPSTNHAYTADMYGKRTLTVEGKKFKRETKAIVAGKNARIIVGIKPNKPYLIVARFFFKELENRGWAKGKTDNRYKTLDATNRIKLLEDALGESIGVNDSNNMTVVEEKKQGEPERTILFIWSLEDEECIVYDALRYVE